MAEGDAEAFPKFPFGAVREGSEGPRRAPRGILVRSNVPEGVFVQAVKEDNDVPLWMNLRLQATDVKKPRLAVRRIVEKGFKVALAAGEGESYIQSVATKVKIPIKKTGGSFVSDSNFVKRRWILWGGRECRTHECMQTCCKTDVCERCW